MAWPPDPDEVAKHDKEAHEQRKGQKYNTPPPKPPKDTKKGGKK